MELNSLYDLQQLTVVAPSLEELTVSSCFDNVCRSSQPVVNISAPQLVMLRWSDAFNPSSVELGNVAHLESLDTSYFLVYGPDEVASNASCLMMLSQFKAIHHLNLNLAYMPVSSFSYAGVSYGYRCNTRASQLIPRETCNSQVFYTFICSNP